jgi:hypothetical protein
MTTEQENYIESKVEAYRIELTDKMYKSILGDETKEKTEAKELKKIDKLVEKYRAELMTEYD